MCSLAQDNQSFDTTVQAGNAETNKANDIDHLDGRRTRTQVKGQWESMRVSRVLGETQGAGY